MYLKSNWVSPREQAEYLQILLQKLSSLLTSETFHKKAYMHNREYADMNP